MAEKWSNWIIAGMPAQVLETAIEDTRVQLEKIKARLPGPDNRTAELEKYAVTLADIGESLAAEKARRG